MIDTLKKILSAKSIKPVYQPIVSLIDGQVFGFEALSRVTCESQINIEQLFKVANDAEKTWELETLCREKALQNARNMDSTKKLFLNVNPNVIHDEEFRKGFTMEQLKNYGLKGDNIIFEITEYAITDSKAFFGSIQHYKNQNFKIAIDDVGAGFSGLNAIASVKPSIIKIDTNLVRDIDKDRIKQLLCKAMADFGKNSGIKVVAEGIETEAELKTLIKLRINYGQGFFLARPQEDFATISPEKMKLIAKYNSNYRYEIAKDVIYHIISPMVHSEYPMRA